jgi:hypothetical protein
MADASLDPNPLASFSAWHVGQRLRQHPDVVSSNDQRLSEEFGVAFLSTNSGRKLPR